MSRAPSTPPPAPPCEQQDSTAIISKPKRGFAAMTPEMRASISAKGGRAAHAQGTARRFDSESGTAAARKAAALGLGHRFTSETARAAGRKTSHKTGPRTVRSAHRSNDREIADDGS
jgi:hypothetical protein